MGLLSRMIGVVLVFVVALWAEDVVSEKSPPAPATVFPWAITASINPMQVMPGFDVLENTYLFLRRNNKSNHAWQIGLWGISEPHYSWRVEMLESSGYQLQKSLRYGMGAVGTIQYVWFFPLNAQARGSIGVGPLLGVGWWSGHITYQRDGETRFAELKDFRWHAGVASTVNVEFFVTDYASFNVAWLVQARAGVERMHQKIWDSSERAILYDASEKSIFLADWIQSQLFLGITLYWGD